MKMQSIVCALVVAIYANTTYIYGFSSYQYIKNSTCTLQQESYQEILEQKRN